MTRRFIQLGASYGLRPAVAVVLILGSLSGCTTLGANENWQLELREVDSAPDKATVLSAENETNKNVPALYSGVTEANSDGNDVTVKELSAAESDTVEAALNSLPAYDRTEGRNGWYIQKDTRTYVVVLIQET